MGLPSILRQAQQPLWFRYVLPSLPHFEPCDAPVVKFMLCNTALNQCGIGLDWSRRGVCRIQFRPRSLAALSVGSNAGIYYYDRKTVHSRFDCRVDGSILDRPFTGSCLLAERNRSHKLEESKKAE
mmetsp:Transcript_14225/g.30147  ORF Transcript_14225/g.30147 Transcript_14225/m.30147 type:complete len:126 (-) Transcript_14225:785-1162(-)